MRAPTTSLIRELEDVLERGSGDKCAYLLHRVTDLFLSAPRYSNETVELYDDIFERLIDHIETKVLVELSERLAPIEHAPPNTIYRLARNDKIEVAGPVLEHSTRLDDTALLELAEGCSQEHLLAISSRARLGEPITEVLVGRGNAAVARRVAANPGARLSETGFNMLARRAEGDGDIAECIVRRPEVPLHVFCGLLARATEEVSQRLLAAIPVENHAQVYSAVNRVSGEVAAAVAKPRNYAAALRTVSLTYAKGELHEHDVLELAAAGRFEEAVAAVSLFSAIPIELVDQVVCGNHVEPVLMLCKAAGLQWPTVNAFLRIRPGQNLSPESFFDASYDFAKLSHSTARRVLRFWQDRSEVRV
jgi:uncharacterized protein (DUF2336 family)